MVANGTQSKLAELKLEVTHRCPLRCIHCSSKASADNTREMSGAGALKILGEALEMGASQVAFSGGEPLLWPSIQQGIAACSRAGVETAVYTSGNINDPRATMRRLKEAGLARIIFSLHAAEPSLHDQVTRTPGSFRKTLCSIEEAAKAGLKAELHFVPMRINFRQLPKLVDLARDCKLSRLSVLRFVPQGEGESVPGLALSAEENLELREMIRGLRRAFEIRIGSPYSILFLSDTPRCLAAVGRLSISPDLHIYPCDAFKGIKADDIVGTDAHSRLDRFSLKDCWDYSPYLHAVRRQHSMRPCRSCAACTILTRCGCGCLAQKYLASGNLGAAADPMCLLKRGNRTDLTEGRLLLKGASPRCEIARHGKG